MARVIPAFQYEEDTDEVDTAEEELLTTMRNTSPSTAESPLL